MSNTLHKQVVHIKSITTTKYNLRNLLMDVVDY